MIFSKYIFAFHSSVKSWTEYFDPGVISYFPVVARHSTRATALSHQCLRKTALITHLPTELLLKPQEPCTQRFIQLPAIKEN